MTFSARGSSLVTAPDFPSFSDPFLKGARTSVWIELCRGFSSPLELRLSELSRMITGPEGFFHRPRTRSPLFFSRKVSSRRELQSTYD